MKLKNTDISWQDVETACRNIADELKDAEKFDCIVCVGRGGMIPSRLMSEHLGIKTIHLVHAHYEIKDTNKKIIVGDYNFKQFEGKNILIVDEVYQTGLSIKAVCDKIFDACDEVCITDCTCYFNKNSKYQPDLWAFTYDDSTDWLVFPWERK